MILKGLDSFDPDERRASVEAIVKFGDREGVIEKLIGLLGDKDKGVRDAVVRSLLSIACDFESLKRKIVEGVCELMCSDDIGLRNLSSELLVKFGSDAIPSLLSLANHENKDIRKMAIDVLGLIGDEKTEDFLIEKLNDPDQNVVVSVIEALGNVGSEKTVEFLIDLFERFEFAQIQIVESLGKIGERCHNDGILKLIHEFLIGSFNGVDDPILKSAIVESLGKVGDKSLVDFLISLVNGDDIAVQKMAVMSIVKICSRYECDFNSNEHFFKFFFQKAKEIFYRTDDIGFKIDLLKFLSKWSEFNEVRGFIINVFLTSSDEVSSVAFDIIKLDAEKFISYALEGSSITGDELVRLIGAIFYSEKEILTGLKEEIKNEIAERILSFFESVSPDGKIVIFEVLPFLNPSAFAEALPYFHKDPVVKIYLT